MASTRLDHRHLRRRQAGGPHAGDARLRASRTPRCEAIAAALLERTDEILEANAARPRARPRGRAVSGAAGPAGARCAAGSAEMAAGVRDDRRAARPRRRGDRRLAAAQRPARCARSACPLGRDRRRLRGAAQRDHRRRRAVPEVRQRGRPARLELGRALQRRARPRSPSRRRPRPACPRVRWRCSAAADRDELAELATQTGVVDLIIPRGGEGLKAALKGWPPSRSSTPRRATTTSTSTPAPTSRPPQAIVLNAKLQRPGYLQRGRDAARAPRRRGELPARRRSARCATAGVVLHGDERARAAAPGVAIERGRPRRTGTPSIWRWRWRSAWSTRPRRRSPTSTPTAAATRRRSSPATPLGARLPARRRRRLRVRQRLDAVHRRGEFGKGAEIGNSTQKLHARGPIGLRELCTFKYLVEGAGHIRAVES